MPTNAQLQAEVDRLTAENARLRDAAAQSSSVARPAPTAPSFGMSEGTRQEIEMAKDRIDAEPRLNEVIVTDPFTGKAIRVTPDDEPDDEFEDDDED
jgi:hypothetical protein